MEVIQAKSAGFCFGVARAVKIAQELADSAQKPRMLGSVIHNQRVTEDLARQGMTAISGPEEAQALQKAAQDRPQLTRHCAHPPFRSLRPRGRRSRLRRRQAWATGPR